MSSRSPYTQYEETNRHRSPSSTRESSNSLAYSKKENLRRNMKDDHDIAREEGGTRNSRDRSPDTDRNSDSYYSDDYDNTTYGSEEYQPTPKPISPPRTKKAGYKAMSVTPVHNRGIRKPNSKLTASKQGPRWGFRSQSLNKESSPKDIDMVTKRVLSARLMKIQEQGNKIAQLQLMVAEYQKENKILKRLQFRQEKALNKFEDTENEISQLLSRHNNEVRTLMERLRKSQERERNLEKKLKETEDERYRTSVTLKKLKQLSENKHLAERDELSRKLEAMESKLDERERRLKDLEKNIELTQNSFQRQLLVEKKKAHNAQEENKSLQEELQHLIQKLKEKERELDVKNIYAHRLSKPSPKKDTELTPRKKGINLNTIAVQTPEYFSQLEPFPDPPPPITMDDTLESQQDVLKVEQDSLAKLIKEEAEKHKKEKEQAERKRDLEEKLHREREQKILEDKARKLRAEWEREELERKSKEAQDKLLKEESINKTEEERIRKEHLLAKMFEIDRESRDPFDTETSNPVSSTSLANLSIAANPTDSKQKAYRFSKPTENLFNGLPTQGVKDKDIPSRKNDSSDTYVDFTFGSYTPSFGKGRIHSSSQKKDETAESVISKLEIKKEKKTDLMEQLFGTSSTSTLPFISKTTDQTGLVSSSSRVAHQDAGDTLPWEQNRKLKGTTDVSFTGEGKNLSSSRQHSQHTPGRTIIKAVHSLEDEIEELAL